MIVPIAHYLCNLIVSESKSTQKILNKVDELRVVSGHMLGASGVQIPKNNLDNLELTREVDGEFKIVDPQFLLGFEMLDGLDPKILRVVALRGSSLVEVILVKGHAFPTSVKILLFLVLSEDYDLLVLVELFIPVEGNTDSKSLSKGLNALACLTISRRVSA
ncbi:hypothetical protein Tco_1484703 [Tanacetum coccineum]